MGIGYPVCNCEPIGCIDCDGFGSASGYLIFTDRGGARIERALFGSGGHPDFFDIFGSRATSIFDKTSDIDLVVFSTNLSYDDFLSLQVMLDKLTIIHTFDVLHYERITNKNLKNEINQTKKLIYKK